MIRQFLAVLLLIAFATACARAQDAREVILAARRTPVVEVIDATTLDTIARFHFDLRVDKLQPSADGRELSIDGYPRDGGCCRHYLLDLASLTLTDRNIRNYPIVYLPSPDGHWRFELRNFPGPSLTTVNLDTKEALQLVPAGLLPQDSEGNWAATGTWSGERFYLYVASANHPGFLWTVLPGDRQLGPGIPVDPFNAASGCRNRLPISKSLVVSGASLFIFEPFGSKADRTGVCQTQLPGGAWKLDPATGRLSAYIAPEFHFNVLRASQSGSTLYGVDPGSANWSGPVRLVSLDSQDGTILKTRSFDPGVLQIAVGHLRGVPNGDVQVPSRKAGE